MDDIRTFLVYNTDINSLLELCEKDEDTKKICQDESFWQEKYENEFIPFHIFYNDYKSNILEYEYALKCKKSISNLFVQPLPMGTDYATYHIYVNNPKTLDIFYGYIFYEELVKKFLPILISLKDEIDSFSIDMLENRKLWIPILYEEESFDDITYKLNANGKEYQLTIDDMEYFFYEKFYKKIPIRISFFDMEKGRERIYTI